ADRNRSHWSTSKTPSYTKSVSWQHHPCLTELQTRLRESLALRQQNESVVRLMQQQLQQAVMTHSWIYIDAQLLRDDIQTLFTAERY
ncbi:hypothetical protein PO601_23355, partial [Escherichia coli]